MCKFIHPSGVCQQHSKFGFCNNEQPCLRRHPVRNCFNYESYGSCQYGDSCCFRHPAEFNNSNYFLGRSNSNYNRRYYQPNNNSNYNRRNHQPNYNSSYNKRNYQTENNYHYNNRSSNLREERQRSYQTTKPWDTLSPDNLQYHDLRGSRW